MKDMTVFDISSEKWLCGEGSAESYLLRESDQKQCFIGQVGEQLGVPRIALLNRKVTQDIDVSRWLPIKRNDQRFHRECGTLYYINDETKML